MAKNNYYEVELKPSNEAGAKATMFRGGRSFELRKPQVLDLTKEEVELYQNDRRFKIKKTNAPSEPVESDEASEGEDVSQSAETAGEEVSTDESEDTTDTDTTPTEEASDEVTVESLIKNNSREELNALAKEAGVEDPEKLENKPEVAQAIVDVKAPSGDDEATSNE